MGDLAGRGLNQRGFALSLRAVACGVASETAEIRVFRLAVDGRRVVTWGEGTWHPFVVLPVSLVRVLTRRHAPAPKSCIAHGQWLR
jgi:hypothetical protein